MNKKEFIKSVASKIDGATQKDISVVLDTMVETVKETLATGDKIGIVGFGTFEVTEYPERTGRNPSTGEQIILEPAKVPKFKVSKAFKNDLNS